MSRDKFIFSQGLDGVVWPTHIMERPDSEFKERLMCVLRKPFSQGEYDMLLDKATTRPPATMKRQTRGGVKYYNSEHERQPSYFDGHPGMLAFILCPYFFLVLWIFVTYIFLLVFIVDVFSDNYLNPLAEVSLCIA